MKHMARMRTVEKRLGSKGLTNQMKMERIRALFRQLDDRQLEIVRDWSSDKSRGADLLRQLNRHDRIASADIGLDAAAIVEGICAALGYHPDPS